jgi:molecular chaperone GrpE
MENLNAKADADPGDTAKRHQLEAPEEATGQTPRQMQEGLQSGKPYARPASLEKISEERDDLLDRFARMQAEFENTRKRLAREQDEFKDLALAEALKSLLPVLDGFDWALQTPHQNIEEFRSGIDLIRKQLQDALSNLGLRTIPAKGEPFDPHLHEAVETVNTTAAQDNYVLEDLRRGYKLKDRLLRPAMVLVARSAEDNTHPEKKSENS